MGKFTVNRGTTFIINVLYTKDKVPADLTGATVRFTMKPVEWDSNTTDSDASVKKNVTSHTDPTAGKTQIVLNPVDTATIEPKVYHYDIKVAEAGGAVYKIDEGLITLDGSPTNRLT